MRVKKSGGRQSSYLGGASNGGYHNEKTGFRSYFISFDDGARLELMNKPGLVDENKDLNRKGFRIQGILDFSLIGILSKIAKILAENSISIFAISTYNKQVSFIDYESLTPIVELV